MSLLAPPVSLTGGGVYDGEASEAEWIYHSTGKCWRCNKEFGQTCRFQRAGALEIRRPSPEDVQDAMLQMMQKNHKCKVVVH